MYYKTENKVNGERGKMRRCFLCHTCFERDLPYLRSCDLSRLFGTTHDHGQELSTRVVCLKHWPVNGPEGYEITSVRSKFLGGGGEGWWMGRGVAMKGA